jgi:hypothetical protein
MLSAMALAILPLLDGASDPVPADDDVKAGWIALLLFAGLVLAVVVLARSFLKQMRKTEAARQAGVYGDPPAGLDDQSGETPGPAPATDDESREHPASS